MSDGATHGVPSNTASDGGADVSEESMLRAMGLPTSFTSSLKHVKRGAKRGRAECDGGDASASNRPPKKADNDAFLACTEQHPLEPKDGNDTSCMWTASPPCIHEGESGWLWFRRCVDPAVGSAFDASCIAPILWDDPSADILRSIDACDPALLREIADAKNAFQSASEEHSVSAFVRARSDANPFEYMRSGPFSNRAAVKLATLDHVTQITDTWEAIQPLHGNSCEEMGKDPLASFSFVDICGGPGGFTEYLLWSQSRRGMSTRGWGMSLRGVDCDWRMEKMHPIAKSLLSSFEITYGADGTGNVYCATNVECLARHVMEGTASRGVHVVVADGGFGGARDRHDQEDATFRILCAQISAALRCLAIRGNFICKAFDLATTRSLSLIWVLTHLFDAVTIAKPVTSRPASSERYLVCKRLRADAEVCASVSARLFDIVLRCGEGDDLCDGAAEASRIASVVESNAIATDRRFLEFMRQTNANLFARQLDASHAILRRFA